MQNQFFIPKGFDDLLTDYLQSEQIQTDQTVCDFSDDQKRAFIKLKEGQTLLVTGEGGTGKSHLIKVFVEWVRTQTSKTIYITATTGISSYNIGGITINSFMGIGTGVGDCEALLHKVRRQKQTTKRLREMDILIIDEISMMSAEFFEKLNYILCAVRRNNLLFGGVQLLLSGDFLQLLPVFNKNDTDRRLIFQSDLFRNTFTKSNTISLEKNWRQMEDKTYSELLKRIRYGIFTEDDIKLLNDRTCTTPPSDCAIRLVSSNKKANDINKTNLDKILVTQKSMEYKASYLSNFTEENEVFHLLQKELSFQLAQRDMENIRLAKGARVMLVKNIDVENGLVNGATGIIKDFEWGFPVVKFDSGQEVLVKETEWELEINSYKMIARQVPLMLAWAITTHKSQSLTFNSAIMDLSDCFTDAMVYVALSRVRTLSGIYLSSFDPRKITVNQKTIEFLKTISPKWIG
jgi:ATP-dependent DNA helicase PIF1